MARPIKTGMDYFPHDTDSCSDEKIEALMLLYGAKGYAFYFILLERIYRTNNLELDISDAETIQILSRKISITTDEFFLILNTSLKYKCFDKIAYEKDKILTSDGIKKRANVVFEKRNKMRIAYESKYKGVSDAETTQEIIAETPQSKEKKSKVLYIDENIKTWRNDFETYLSDCKKGYASIINDSDFMERLQKLNPKINIRSSLEMGFIAYWGSEEGWKNKKSKKSKTIDWKSTIIKTIKLNAVYY